MPRKLNKDALPSDKLLNLYQRLTLSDARHFQTDMARDLGCSPQTVSRLIERIEPHLGKSVCVERGMEGRRRYYRLVSESRKNAMGFTFEELNFLAICRDLAAPFLPDPVVRRIDDSISSLALMLGEKNEGNLKTGFRSKGYIDYSDHLSTIICLRKAIAKKQICQVQYTAKGRKEPSYYRYAPGRLVTLNAALYVQGYRIDQGSLLPEKPTTFLLHRISDIRFTGEYYRFNAADEASHYFGLDWHKPKRMQIKIAPEAADYVRDRIWSEDQVIEDHLDGSLTLTLTTTSEKELTAWVLSFAGQAAIISETFEQGRS
ncbi:WYL domain-containing protein [Thalassospira sp. SN3W]|uniref:helix-turn-helix transcriptional regulator n=1 Tax=Thalassospira sp. SN3W TaxID=3035476 RepID=UPI00311B3233